MTLLQLTRWISRILIIFALLLICVPAFGETENEKATVDDLFGFFVDNWANKTNLSMSDLSMCDAQVLDSSMVMPGMFPESNFRDALEDFANKTIDSEDIYGHLPEYWELRAVMEDESGTDWIQSKSMGFLGLPFSNQIYTPSHNTALLEKALDLNPSSSSLVWFIGKANLNNEMPDGLDWRDQANTKIVDNYYSKLADIYANAGSLEPDNAFYAIHESGYRQKFDDKDKLLKLLKRASECEYYSFPRIFPSSYALEHISEFENGEKPFNNITPGAKYHLFLHLYVGADQLPNYLTVRNSYRDIIANSQSDDDWGETLNILHRAACVMGTGEGNDKINCLVAGTLVKICLSEALNRADNTDDASLKMAVIAAIEKASIPKTLSKASGIDDKMLYAFLYSIFIDDYNQRNAKSSISISMFLPPILEKRLQCQIHQEYIKPIFISLKKFDYTNPGEWFESWMKENFPSRYKNKE